MKKMIIASVVLISGCLFVAFANPLGTNPENNTQTKTTKFVKTSFKCKSCKCRGYHGIKHDAGTYEGKCSNSDGYGHPCGHGPEKHGLKKY